MCKYLYLSSEEYARTWTNGGKVPIRAARTYRSIERKGTHTPDEVLQKTTTGGNFRDLIRGVKIGDDVTINSNVFTNCTFNGVHIKGPLTYSQHSEEALILCMSNVFDSEIMRRLEKTACVQIPNVHHLRATLDKEIGFESEYRDVQYTRDLGNRNHFLKGIEDSWQQEYRFVWIGKDLGTEEKWVTLPTGLAFPL